MPKSVPNMNENEFLKQYPEAERHPEIEGETAKAYLTKDGTWWLFGKVDGHLAWKFDMRRNKVMYECSHIKKGRMLISSIFSKEQQK